MSLKSLKSKIKSDLKCHGATCFLTVLRIYFFDTRFRLLLNYRLGRFLIEKQVKILPEFYKRKQIIKRGCHISFFAQIGHEIKFMHPLGIVIGDDVCIGDNVQIWQQVTLGSHGKIGSERKYPKIGNNVKIYAGAKIIGDVIIGDNATIGANAVVLKNVPPNRIAVGIPAKII
ncbi:serine acetyltransferase [Flavobacteriaceae bacterium TP-CH-4]|uniref:Serine acetyltransferase n=1 Tax=Pelagihabitans pacificus TaxID=2696054 RepID=A0A967E8K4_9FLAO|nr:serine acetyltransferase [Pelagihabitans pacificus]NHF61384.1 serine acetyltransferase [Pelagihabitans pacificus]